MRRPRKTPRLPGSAPVEVAAEDFVTEDAATLRLGLRHLLTVDRLVAEGRLVRVSCRGVVGVSAVSVDAEAMRRTGRLWRLRSAVRSVLHWV